MQGYGLQPRLMATEFVQAFRQKQVCQETIRANPPCALSWSRTNHSKPSGLALGALVLLRANLLCVLRPCIAPGGEVVNERDLQLQTLRLHGDCHAGNVLWTEGGQHFVDFDDSRTAPAVQDLWMLLSGERADMTRKLSDVLAGYEDFYEFDPRELHLIEALRTLRLIHYATWLAHRWDDPAFKQAFPWFNT